MTVSICYLKSGHRRPIALHPLPGLRDAQEELPVAWCSGCGRPVYEAGSTRCCRCKEKEEKSNERFTQ